MAAIQVLTVLSFVLLQVQSKQYLLVKLNNNREVSDSDGWGGGSNNRRGGFRTLKGFKLVVQS